jgi:hypothetical protein
VLRWSVIELGETCGAGKGAVTLGSGASGTSGGDGLAAGAAIGDGTADRTGATLEIGVTPGGTGGVLPGDGVGSIFVSVDLTPAWLAVDIEITGV